MCNKGFKAISNSIFINPPDWLNISSSDAYIELSKDTTKHETDLFIFSLFIHNNIPFSENQGDSLQNLINAINTDGIALGGGIMFYEEDIKILPGCCCGLEQWPDITNNLVRKKSPWLGHDPFPIIDYKDDSIVIWSDDCLGIYGNPKPECDLRYIEFANSDLEHFINQVETDIKEFLTIPFFERIKEIDRCRSDEFLSAAMKWLDITV